MTIQRPRGMDTKATSAYTGVPAAQLKALRHKGGGPLFVKVGRKVLYLREDVDAWLEARRVRSTSDFARLPGLGVPAAASSSEQHVERRAPDPLPAASYRSTSR